MTEVEPQPPPDWNKIRATILAELKQWPTLSEQHEDIAQTVLSELVGYRGHILEARRLARTITRRRVIDALRKVRIAAADIEAASKLCTPESSIPRAVHIREVYAFIMNFAQGMTQAEHELLDRQTEGGTSSPLTDVERQRLSRAREKLRQAVLDRFGETLERLLDQ